MISVIVPVYNSKSTVSELVDSINKALNIEGYEYEIILVDDASKDESFEQIKKIAKESKNVIGIKLKKNVGQQNAILCGLREANGEFFVTIDDDLQYNPEDIISLITNLDAYKDIIYAIPKEKRHSTYRNMGTRINHYLFERLFHLPKNIFIGSFRIMNKDIRNKVIKEKRSFVYITASSLLHTKKIGNIFVEHKKRLKGKSNYNISRLICLFFNIIIYYSQNPVLKMFRKNKKQYEIVERIN